MKIFNTRSLLGCGLALALFAGNAQAAPITIAIDSAASSLTLRLEVPPFVNIVDTSTVSGSLSADLNIAEAGGSTDLTATGGALSFTDMNLAGPIVSVTITNLGGQFLGGPIGGTLGPTVYNFDPTGLVVNLNQGLLTTTLDPANPTDLSVAPLPLGFTSTSSLQITASDLGGGLFDIDFLLTINEAGVLDFNGTDIQVTSTGQIAGSGTLDTTGGGTVPEPGSLLLTGLALAGLSTLRRR